MNSLENKGKFCPIVVGQNSEILSHGTNALSASNNNSLHEFCPILVPWDKCAWDSGTKWAEAYENNNEICACPVGQNNADHLVCPAPPISKIGADGTVMGQNRKGAMECLH